MNVTTNLFISLLIMTLFLYNRLIVSFFSDFGLIYTGKPLTVTIWLCITDIILILFFLYLVFKQDTDTEE